MAYGYNPTFIAYDEASRIRVAEDRVLSMLWQIAALRRPSIRALKLTGCCFHPSRVG